MKTVVSQEKKYDPSFHITFDLSKVAVLADEMITRHHRKIWTHTALKESDDPSARRGAYTIIVTILTGSSRCRQCTFSNGS